MKSKYDFSKRLGGRTISNLLLFINGRGPFSKQRFSFYNLLRAFRTQLFTINTKFWGWNKSFKQYCSKSEEQKSLKTKLSTCSNWWVGNHKLSVMINEKNRKKKQTEIWCTKNRENKSVKNTKKCEWQNY
jgi:hypothetical protein